MTAATPPKATRGPRETKSVSVSVDHEFQLIAHRAACRGRARDFDIDVIEASLGNRSALIEAAKAACLTCPIFLECNEQRLGWEAMGVPPRAQIMAAVAYGSNGKLYKRSKDDQESDTLFEQTA